MRARGFPSWTRRWGVGLALLVVTLCPLYGGEGQGTAQPGANLKQLSTGDLLFGGATEVEQLLGKVVVVNIGGG